MTTNRHAHVHELYPTGGAAAALSALQLEQFRHDETYHREITRLTVHQRLNHMALHFAKYVGLIASEAHQNSDEQRLNRAIIDGFIIGLSTANVLNLKLSDHLIGNQGPFLDLRTLG